MRRRSLLDIICYAVILMEKAILGMGVMQAIKNHLPMERIDCTPAKYFVQEQKFIIAKLDIGVKN